jgi:hypothetical protein
MLDRVVETICALDDFCQAFIPQWEAYLLETGCAPRGPQPGLCVSEIITISPVLHSSRCRYLKSFYQGIMGDVLRQYFPAMSCDERFVTLQKKRVHALDVLPAQLPGTKERHSLH